MSLHDFFTMLRILKTNCALSTEISYKVLSPQLYSFISFFLIPFNDLPICLYRRFREGKTLLLIWDTTTSYVDILSWFQESYKNQ